MTQLALLFIGAIALLATFGLFYRFGDRWTALLVEFSATFLWGLFAISAMDVIVTSHVSPPESDAIMPLVYLGIGFAFVTFVYSLYDLVEGVNQEAQEVKESELLR